MTRAAHPGPLVVRAAASAALLLLAIPRLAGAQIPNDPAARAAFRAVIERWHDFYLLAGTAAVTLAGLLFVALSIHVDHLVHESREHLLRLSRGTLSSFILVLAISLVFLSPVLSERILGVEILVFGVMFSILWVLQTRPRSRNEDPAVSSAQMKRSFRLPLAGYLLTALVGVFLLRGDLDSLGWMIGVVCLLLGNAAATSWELLVRVARARQASARGIE